MNLKDKLEQPEEQTPFHLKEKIYDMMCYGHPILRTFPRRERKLADRIDEKMGKLLELSIVIERKYHKATTLKEIDTELDALRHFIRLAADDKYFNHQGDAKDEAKKRVAPPLSRHQYEVWSRAANEVGCIIGGLIKSAK